jgi:hypothetical protein
MARGRERHRPARVDRFDKSGDFPDLYRTYGIDYRRELDAARA